MKIRHALPVASVLLMAVLVAASAPVPASAASPSVDQAVPPGAVEIPSNRTEYATHYQFADGSYWCDLSSQRVRYRDASGDWRAIDPLIVPESPGVSRNAANDYRVQFGDAGSGVKPVRVAKDGWAFEMEPLFGVALNQTDLGEQARFPSVARDTDLVYESGADGVKETVILKSSEAPSMLSFRLSFSGLDLRGDDSSGWQLYRAGGFTRELTLGRLSVQDSAATPARPTDATMSVTPISGGAIVSISLPQSWLADPARIFPVEVDPSVWFGASADTYVYQGVPTWSGGGTSVTMKEGWDTGGYYESFLKFDMATSGLPSNAYIDNTTLKLYADAGTAQLMGIGRTSGNGLWTPSWAEGTTNWNNRPGQTRLCTANIPSTAGWVQVSGNTNIRDAVRDWWSDYIWGDGTYPYNDGFKFYRADTSSAIRYLHTRHNAAYPPSLGIGYVTPSVTISTDKTSVRADDSEIVSCTVTVATGSSSGVADEIADVRLYNSRLDLKWTTMGLVSGYSSLGGLAGGDMEVGNAVAGYVTPVANQWSVTTSADGQTKYFTFKWKVKPGYGNVQNLPLQATVNIGGYERWLQSFTGPAMNVLPTASLSATPTLVGPGRPSTLTWSSAVASVVSISPGIGTVGASGSRIVNPVATTTYTITASNSAGSATASALVRVDNIPPTTTLSGVGSWQGSSPVTFTLAASDDANGTGLCATYYKLGDSATTTYTSTVSVSSENTTVVSYWSVDKGGNKEATKTANILIDTTPPSITATTTTQPNAAGWFGSDVTVLFSATDAGSGVSSVTPNTLLSAEGSNLVASGTATDVAGNVATASVGGINIDKTAPQTSSDATDTYCGLATIHLTAIDALSGVDGTYYSLDGSPSQPGTLVVASIPGDHILNVWSVDVAGNTELQQTLPFTVLVPLPAVSLSASPTVIQEGDSATLSWTSMYADALSLEPGLGAVLADGSAAVTPSTDTTYVLSASNASGEASAQVFVRVNRPPTATISAIPTAGPAPLTVFFDAAASCDPDGGITSYHWWFDGVESTASAPAHTFTQPGSYVATLQVTDDLGGRSETTVPIVVTIPAPTISASALPPRLLLGQEAILSWASENASSVVISGGIGAVETAGSRAISPLVDTTYTIMAAGPGGVATTTVFVAVTPVAAQPEGSFGSQYEDLVPGDATVASYDAGRFSLVVGTIRDTSGSPVGGVAVTCSDHAEYGTAVSGPDGGYALPVDGGGQLGFDFGKSGYAHVHRDAQVGWNRVETIDDVVLTPLDSAVSQITLDGSTSTVEVHRSTTTLDGDGARSCSIVFRGDNVAWGTDASGMETTLSSFDVRATEYTTPSAMPGELPRSTAFTYCTELSVDGYESVRFADPVTLWVDNFLGMPVGTVVPVGYFDRERNCWVPSPDGIVVRLLDTDSDGVVDALDTDDDGAANRIGSSETTSDDVAGLGDPSVYHPGDTYWRASTDHFTPFDLNWPAWLPEGSFAYSGDPSQGKAGPGGCQVTNSYVDRKHGVYTEDIPIPGTGLVLHYSSDRVSGYRPTLDIPVSGASVPTMCTGIEAQVSFAGRNYSVDKPAAPGQQVHVAWDGRDRFGRVVNGTVPVEIKIKYYYPLVYYPTSVSPNGRSFGGARLSIDGGAWAAPIARAVDGTQVPMPARAEGWIDTRYSFNLSIPMDVADDGLGEGWTLGSHHALSPKDPSVLFKGDGTTASKQGYTVSTASNTLYEMTNIVSSRSGELLAVARAQPYWPVSAWRMDPRTGARTLIAGGTGPYTSEGHPATQTLIAVDDVNVDGDDALIIDSTNYRVWRISDGIAYLVAGNGSLQTTLPVEGATAKNTALRPVGAASDGMGNTYIVDWPYGTSLMTVHRIDSSGAMHHVVSGFGLGHLRSDGRGNVYALISRQVVKITPDGVVEVVAGSGGTHSGWPYPMGTDEMPATAVAMEPTDFALDCNGRLFIADATWSRGTIVRVVELDGMLRNFAGNSDIAPGLTGENVAANQALLVNNASLAVDPAGTVYVNNSGYPLRKISVPFAGSQNDPQETLFPDKNGQGYVIDPAGRHVRTIDLASGGTVSTFTLDGAGHVTAVTDRFGASTHVVRESSGTIQVVSPDGVRTELNLDGSGHLAQIVYPDQAEYAFTYDSGLMTEERDPLQHSFTHHFDSEGRIESVSNPDGETRTFSRAISSGNAMRAVMGSVEGNTTIETDHVDLAGNFTGTSVNAAGAVSTTTLTPDETRLASVAANGTRTDIDYTLDPIWSTKMLLQQKTTLPSGLARTITHSRSYPRSAGSSSGGLIVDTTAINGRGYVESNDASAGVYTVTTPESRTSTTSYDPVTLLPDTYSVPGLFPVHSLYDTRGRLSTVTVGTRVTVYSYDTSGNLESIVAADGNRYSFGHDLVGRRTGTTGPGGLSLAFGYNAVGNLTSLTPSTLATSAFAYDASGRRTSWTAPEGSPYAYTYDREGNLASIVPPSGRSITETYTNGMLSRVSFAEGQIFLENGG